jgi:Cdc6-like AAA superfamily ATPase
MTIVEKMLERVSDHLAGLEVEAHTLATLIAGYVCLASTSVTYLPAGCIVSGRPGTGKTTLVTRLVGKCIYLDS